MPARDRQNALRLERAIYARVAAAMRYPDPSSLLKDLSRDRQRRYSPVEISARWATAAAQNRPGTAWNLYVHVPYCKSICDFCNYSRLRVSSTEALDAYAAFIAAEARLLAPALRGVRFGAIYIGGGTPSVLSARQLEVLFSALFASFDFEPHAQKTFEFDPMVMTEDRHEVVRRFGFSRFSFGIQSLQPDVNRSHNRGPQSAYHVDRQFELLERHGRGTANVDFLLGLAGTTPEQMLADIEQVLSKHEPNQVCVYFIFPTDEYVAKHFGGQVARFREFLAPFEARLPAALAELAQRLGYEMMPDGHHILRLTRRRPLKNGFFTKPEFNYCDVPSEIHRPLHVLGLGDSARSRIFGSLWYRADHDHGAHDPNEQRYVGIDASLADEMFEYVAMLTRDAPAISREFFRRTFAADFVETFARPLRKLEELGAAQIEADRVLLTAGTRHERLRDLLFLLPSERRGALGSLPGSASTAVAAPARAQVVPPPLPKGAKLLSAAAPAHEALGDEREGQ